jgi:hypothetical protein
VIEQAFDAGSLDGGEIFEHAVLAFGREQLREIASREFVAVMAEQRFGAAVGRMDVAFGIEHHDAFGGGVEDGAEPLRRWRGRPATVQVVRVRAPSASIRVASAMAAAIAAPRGACPRRSRPARIAVP